MVEHAGGEVQGKSGDDGAGTIFGLAVAGELLGAIGTVVVVVGGG